MLVVRLEEAVLVGGELLELRLEELRLVVLDRLLVEYKDLRYIVVVYLPKSANILDSGGDRTYLLL